VTLRVISAILKPFYTRTSEARKVQNILARTETYFRATVH